ncbi:tetratricopeptide-like helical [Fusarium sp. NRRL 25303]|nr:tetratricopeptide-like helical [Fusarium sp. NRRL 25303]
MEAVKDKDEMRPKVLDYLLRLGFTQVNHPNDLTATLNKIEETLAMGKNTITAGHYEQVANLYYNKFGITSQQCEILNAISYAKSALEVAGDDTRYRANRLINLASYQLTLYQSYCHGDVLQDAIHNTREAVELCGHDPDNGLHENMVLASALYYNYEWSGHKDDLDEAIEVSWQVVNSTRPQDRDWVDRMRDFTTFAKAENDAGGTLDNLNNAIDLLEQAMNNDSLPDETRHNSAVLVLDLVAEKYESSRADLDFDLALHAYNMSLDPPPGEYSAPETLWERWSRAAATISTLYRNRFEVSKDPQDIDTSIDLARTFVPLLPDEDSEDNNGCSSALALALWTDFRARGGIQKLDEAVDLAAKIPPCRSPRDENYVNSLTNLNGICQTRYHATGNEADLLMCLDSALKALGTITTNRNMTLKISLLLSTSSAYINMARRYGDMEDVQLAVRHASEAKQLAGDRRLGVEISTSLDLTLSQALILRYHHFQALADLTGAVGSLQHARVTASGYFLLPIVLNNLGEALRLLYSRIGNSECLIDAIGVLEEALATASPDDPAKAMYQSNLSLSLFYLFKVAKEPEKAETLNRSIEASERAIQETVPGDTQLANRLSLSGVCYGARFELTQVCADLDKAISQTQAAIDATPPDNPQCGTYYNNLGWQSMERSFQRDVEDGETSQGSGEDRQTALQAYKRLLYMAGANPLDRVVGGYSASSIAFNNGDLEVALEMVEKAVKMLPKISPLALDRSDQEYALSGISGLSAYATSIVLEATSDASRALRLQEASRGVIAGLTIAARNDIGDLEAQAPDIAAEYRRCRDLLSKSPPAPHLISDCTSPTASHGLDKRELNKKLDALEEKIRREVPGFANFQLPLSINELKALANKGPVVSFNVSHIRSDAFIITQTDITSIPLPDLKEEDLNNNAKLFLEKPIITHGSLNTKNARNRSMLRILKWLWDVAVRPVVEALDIHQSPKDKKLPRIWWTSSGLMALMPIHAAGDHTSDGTPNMFNFAIPSYTTTLRALAYARETEWKPLRGTDCQFAFVASPNKAREDTELKVEESARELNDLVQQHCKARVLKGPTKTETLAVLEACNAVFFGCHGQSISTQPCESYLKLGTDADSHLTIKEIQGSRHQDAQLAYLSACSTANLSARHLVDEVVHIAGAFSLLGFRQVVGTFWEAKDIKARVVAKRFYEELMLQDCEDEDCVARAYHTAVMEMRGSKIQDPLVWATFAHFGA